MNNPKLINLLGNIFLALNLVAGLLWLHWAVIAVFGILHTGVRLAYLSASDKLAQASQDPNAQKTVTAPPMIRNMASVVTSFIVAGILYAVGYGIRYGFNMMAG